VRSHRDYDLRTDIHDKVEIIGLEQVAHIPPLLLHRSILPGARCFKPKTPLPDSKLLNGVVKMLKGIRGTKKRSEEMKFPISQNGAKEHVLHANECKISDQQRNVNHLPSCQTFVDT